jgi:hypothetical protein
MPAEIVFDPDLAQILDRLRSAPVKVSDQVGKLHPIVKRIARSMALPRPSPDG